MLILNNYNVNTSYKTNDDSEFIELAELSGGGYRVESVLKEESIRLGYKAKRMRLKITATNVPGLLFDHIGIVYKPKRVK